MDEPNSVGPRTATEASSSMGLDGTDHPALLPTTYTFLLGWFLIPFPVCNSPWQLSPDFGISNIMGSQPQPRLHYDSLMQRLLGDPLKELETCHTLPDLLSSLREQRKKPWPLSACKVFVFKTRTTWTTLSSSVSSWRWLLTTWKSAAEASECSSLITWRPIKCCLTLIMWRPTWVWPSPQNMAAHPSVAKPSQKLSCCSCADHAAFLNNYELFFSTRPKS